MAPHSSLIDLENIAYHTFQLKYDAMINTLVLASTLCPQIKLIITIATSVCMCVVRRRIVFGAVYEYRRSTETKNIFSFEKISLLLVQR